MGGYRQAGRIMPIDWEQRALQAERDRDRCLHKIKQYREIIKAIKCQIFVADGIKELAELDGLDKYRHTYP